MHAIAARRPDLFADDVTQLFCRYNDPSYVKTLRLELITFVCTEKHFQVVSDELSAYVTDVDADLARASIKALGVSVCLSLSLSCPCVCLCPFATLHAFVSFSPPLSMPLHLYLRHSALCICLSAHIS
jgi:hypothetical protein